MSAVIISLAAARAARTLPAPRDEAGQPLPPAGKRPGDKVRDPISGAIGTVTSWRVERVWKLDTRQTFVPTFMLGVQFPDMALIVLAEDVDPVSIGTPSLAEARMAAPSDIEA